ncbi:MAG: gene transfer agent family protein [Hyphomonadaceae bacterium]|nr:gene transfer agent family protein [Hyphomonadaceae bacterium]
MANPVRGEVAVQIGEVDACLCLTLGALAEIQSALEAHTLGEIAARLAKASPADMMAVLAALLRGGGHGDLAGQLANLPVSPAMAARWITEAFEAAVDAR